MTGRLDKKAAVITGGCGTLGMAAARRFVQEGARVFLVDTNEDELKQNVQNLGRGMADYAVADVSQASQVQAYVKAAAARFGRINVFLNNAGIEGCVTPITQYPEKVFDRVMDVNVRGVWLGLKYVIPEMIRCGGGSIIISSSVAGLTGSPGVSAYTCSKHAVIGLMRTAALECASLNIRVNTVNPSPVEGRMMQSLETGLEHMSAVLEPDLGKFKARDKVLETMPMGRYARPDEVAGLMLFLASDDSQFCSGGIYMVDGAKTCQ